MTEKKDTVPGKVLTISCESTKDFYRYWLEFLKPIHHLTVNQMQVFAGFLYYRNELSKDISNPEILDKVTMGSDIRKKVREDCEMTTTHFQVVMSTLKKSGVITEKGINPKFIPILDSDNNIFKLSIYFKL